MGSKAIDEPSEPDSPQRQRWLALAEKALAGASFEEKLVSHSDDGIRINPLYERASGHEHSLRANPLKPWIVSQRVDDPDVERARAQVAEDIAQGATGLSLVFEGAPNSFACPMRPTRSTVCWKACRSTRPICASTCIRPAAPWPTG